LAISNAVALDFEDDDDDSIEMRTPRARRGAEILPGEQEATGAVVAACPINSSI
jgi:hypothetical protein